MRTDRRRLRCYGAMVSRRCCTTLRATLERAIEPVLPLALDLPAHFHFFFLTQRACRFLSFTFTIRTLVTRSGQCRRLLCLKVTTTDRDEVGDDRARPLDTVRAIAMLRDKFYILLFFFFLMVNSILEFFNWFALTFLRNNIMFSENPMPCLLIIWNYRGTIGHDCECKKNHDVLEDFRKNIRVYIWSLHRTSVFRHSCQAIFVRYPNSRKLWLPDRHLALVLYTHWVLVFFLSQKFVFTY